MDIESNNSEKLGHRISTLSFSNIRATAASGIQMLQVVSGSVYKGQLLALMGSSGSGKTSLLDIMARRSRIPEVDGEVLFDDGKLTLNDFTSVCGYVEQEDALIGMYKVSVELVYLLSIFVGSLTVRETLEFAAKLSHRRGSFQRESVEDMITALCLTNQADMLIGTPIRRGISGGQKRRVSVGSILIQDPQVLFLDEITSRLDSVATYEVVKAVKRIARQKGVSLFVIV